ncbi:MAG: lysophospholipid acyltransferase family protein [Thermodesulfobacteriota bacterium]
MIYSGRLSQRTIDKAIVEKKGKRGKRDWKKMRLIIFFLPIIYRVYMGVTYFISKKTYINFEGFWERVEKEEDVLCALWHQDIVMAPFFYRKNKKKEIATIASKSRDGEIIVNVLKRFGFITIRGSSSRGGAEALRSMKGYFEKCKGALAGITVDGPRGPAGKVKAGIILLAKETGATIYPLRGWAKRKILLNSWDRTMIPLPFNHFVFVCGEPIIVPKDADKKTLHRIRGDLELSLKEIAERAEMT